MVRFMQNAIAAIVVFFVLSLAYAIFSPIIHSTMEPLVDNALYTLQSSPIEGNNYAQLYSAKVMIVAFFDLFSFAMSFIILFWLIMSAMRRENDDYYVQ